MWVYVAASHPEHQNIQELSVEKWTKWSNDLATSCSSQENRIVNQRVGLYFIKSIVEHAEAILWHGRFPSS